MDGRRDPVQRRSEEGGGDVVDGDVDLYEITSWEPRSALDRIAVLLYRLGVSAFRVIVVALALLFLLLQVVLGGLGAVVDPFVGLLVAFSIVPAFGLAAYVWYLDVTPREPLPTLLATVVLGILFAMFAAVINVVALPAFAIVPIVGLPLYFLLVVGPVEEAVKLLAVRLHAYRHRTFRAVVDGAVYGAAAGLGFATIENAIYITAALEMGLTGVDTIAAVGGTAAARSLAGPGHVIYSAIAGFYLGLARFNPRHAGPLVVKGLLLAIALHAVYNITAVGLYTLPVSGPIEPPVLFLAFLLLYFGATASFLLAKISRYTRAYKTYVGDADHE